MPGIVKGPEDYYKNIMELVPTQIIAFYLAFEKLPMPLPDYRYALLIATLVGLGLIPFYLRLLKRGSLRVILISMVSFLVWVFALGGPFAAFWDGYHEAYGSALVMSWTIFLPLFNLGGKENDQDLLP